MSLWATILLLVLLVLSGARAVACKCCGGKCVYVYRTTWNCNTHAWNTVTLFGTSGLCGDSQGMSVNTWLPVNGSLCTQQYFLLTTTNCTGTGDCPSGGAPARRVE